MWTRARSTSKAGFDKLWGWADKLGAPANRLANKVGSEAFWPTTLDKECDKAARILRSFCKDGFYEGLERPASQASDEQDKEVADGPSKKRYTKVLKKIPAEVVKNAKGIAVFTTMRTGLWISGAGGSGVLVARLPDGSWSPPSGILLHTAGVGFLIGVDIYDCVIVLNTDEAVNAFTKIRCTLGGEISAVTGPVGIGGVLDTEVHKRQAPIFTYLKSRGFYAGVQMDGTIIIERSDENERFYGRKVPVAEILAGKVTKPPESIQMLMQTLKLAQGDTDVDPALLPIEAPPSDFDIASGQVFGVPDRDDPDPYGVMALEKEGVNIREAGTQKRASRESFQFSPSPTSPLFSAFNINGARRLSTDLDSRRSSWKTTSSAQMVDMSTQTEVDTPAGTLSGPPTLPPRSGPPALPPRPHSATFASSMAGIPEMESIDQKISPVSDGPTMSEKLPEPDKVAAEGFEEVSLVVTPAETEAEPIEKQATNDGSTQTPAPVEVSKNEVPPVSESKVVGEEEETKPQEKVEAEKPTQSGNEEVIDLPQPVIKGDEEADADDEDSEDDYDMDDTIIHEVIQASAPKIVTASPQVISKARLVTVAKPTPPALPSRNPNRTRPEASRMSSNLSLSTDAKLASTEDLRPVSRGSSVYSLSKEEDVPSSAKASDSHGSISSYEHHEALQIAHNEPATPVEATAVSHDKIHDSSNANSTITLTPTTAAKTTEPTH